MITYRVGVDVGGTFTDIVLLGSDGTIHVKKVASSVENYAAAIVDGLAEVFRETGLDGKVIDAGVRVGAGIDRRHVHPRSGADGPRPVRLGYTSKLCRRSTGHLG